MIVRRRRSIGRSRSSALAWMLMIAGFFAVAAGGRRTCRAATPEEVQSAIEKAKEYLYRQQNPQGTWERVPKPIPNGEDGNANPDARQWGGLTAISTYALLAAGESPQSEKLSRAIAFLKSAPIEGIYAIGMRCQVWLLLNDDKVRPFIERDRDLLLHALHQDVQQRNNNKFGFYPYYYDRGRPHPRDWYDHSVSQYGVLGMWALEQAGAEVPVKYWEVVDAAWRRAQYTDGGWSYRQKGPDTGDSNQSNETPQMAAAGIATLFITQEYLTADIVACKGNATNENIERGLRWMDQHVSRALSDKNYYGMYGIERIGVASGRKYFGTTNWYDVGADYLVKNQDKDGSWAAQWGPIPDTCFATLFLVRGRAPIVMNKVEYEITEKGKKVEGNWNQRPRDVANFARWMGRQIERDLNWQSVNLKVSAEELHDAPILYLGGNQELNLSDEDTQKLGRFIEQGGLVLGNADCGSRAFAVSFEKLGAKLFPAYKFRDLPITHPIFTVEQYTSRRERMHPRIAGLSNGVRELMLLVPDADLSRAWQARSEKTREEIYHLAANIFLYAVDKRNLRFRGETYLVNEDPGVNTRKSIALVRLQVGDNWDPEPGGWERLKAILHNNPFRLALDVKSAKPDASLAEARIAHLTGTKTFKLTESERSAIKDFVNNGGTLIVDAAGGSSEFADAAENELNAMFGDAAAKGLREPLPPDNIVYRLPIAPIKQVRYRTFARTVLGNLRTPLIKAITIKNRPAVYFSREDLSAGLVGEAIDGITGYEPDVATDIMRNILLNVAGITEAPTPTTKPSTQPETKPATPAGK